MSRQAPKPTPAEIAEEDYAEEMFQEGHNRAEENAKIRKAPVYDKAAHSGSQADVADTTARPVDTAHSRDGTDAVGEYDEDGGSLGGTEKELDDLEAAGTPVDRQPRMKE